ncbi:hypothetical protein NEOLEDRAFT_1176478 [Neolentinus lepideus HHB14362 ss-1]|uniref:Uncharacterized protein n=1 Tax=Neolentinus lepideus HHB14362 ss-1 TaxID=1314782 RepID=A0A165UB49_9AGAM|nr:hypothetical protein NEOLEDRAFT_1176478 [Neolentinus lepideus HHB14362 ss-1]
MAPSARFSAFKASNKGSARQSLELSVNISLPMPLIKGSGKPRQTTPSTGFRAGASMFKLRRKSRKPTSNIEDEFIMVDEKGRTGFSLPTLPSSNTREFVFVEDTPDFKLSESISQEYEFVPLDCDDDDADVVSLSTCSTMTLAQSAEAASSSSSLASNQAEGVQAEEESVEESVVYDIPIHIPANFSLNTIAEEEDSQQPPQGHANNLPSGPSHVSLCSFSSSCSSIRLPDGLLDNLVKMEMMVEAHESKKALRHNLPTIILRAPDEDKAEPITLLPPTAEGKRIELEMDLKRDTFEMIEKQIVRNTHSIPPYYENPKFLRVPGWSDKWRGASLEKERQEQPEQPVAIVFEPSATATTNNGMTRTGTLKVFVGQMKGSAQRLGRAVEIVSRD